MSKPKTVLIVDDHPFTREGLRFYLRDVEDFEVVGEAADGPEAVAQALELHPDFIIMDVRLPGFDGLEATKRLHDLLPATRVLILTTDINGDIADRALDAGAMGWLPKSSSPAELIGTLRHAAAHT